MGSDIPLVGKLAVKIMPETGKFKPRLYRDLKRIENSLKAIEVGITLDATGLTQQAKAAREQAQHAMQDLQLKVNLDDTGSLKSALANVRRELVRLGETDLRVELDRDSLQAAEALLQERLAEIAEVKLRIDKGSAASLRRAIGQIDAELERLREVELGVKLNESELTAAREMLQADLDAVATITLNVDRTAEASVRRELARIDAEIARRREVAIDVHLDDASLAAARSDLDAQLHALTAKPATIDFRINERSADSVRAAVTRLDGELERLRETEIAVAVDDVSLSVVRRQLQQALDVEARVKHDAALNDLARLSAEVARHPVIVPLGAKPDEAAIRRATRQIEVHVERLNELRASIAVEVDPIARRRAEREIEDLQDRIDDLRGEIKPDVSQPWSAKVAATLAFLARPRTVDFKPTVSQAALSKVVAAFAAMSGARVVGDWVRNLGQSLMRLDRTAPIIGALALGLTGIAGWGLTAASNLASLSASLASIAPAALVLPGLFAGAAIGVGVLLAAFKDAGTVLPELKTALSGLQDTISANFWEQAAEPIRSLISTLLPQFSAGLAQTATQMGGLFGSLATSLSGALDGALPRMFADLSASIEIAKGGTDAFATVMRILGETGAGYLPALSAWLVDIGVKFADFLSRAEADGSLKAWIDTALTALADLGRALAGVGGILLGIAKAATASGGSTLTTLADTLQAVSAAINSTTAQSNLVGILTSAHKAMDSIASGAGPGVLRFLESFSFTLQGILPVAGETIGTALDALSNGLAAIAEGGGLEDMFAGLQTGISGLAPALEPVGAALGTLGPIIGALLANIGPLLAAIVGGDGLAPALTSLTGPVLGLIDPLGGALLSAVQAVAPLVQNLAALAGGLLTAILPLAVSLLDLAVGVIRPLGELLSGIVADAMPGLIAAFSEVSAQTEPLIDLLGVIASTLIDVLGPAIGWLVSGALDGLIIALGGLGDIFEGAFTVVTSIWNAWSAVFRGDWSAAWQAVQDAWSGLWQMVVGLLEASFGLILGIAGKGLSLAGDLISGAVEWWWDLFSGFWSTIGGFIADCWNDAVDAISEGVTDAVTWVKKLPVKAAAALADIGSTLLDAGRNLIAGFIDGIGAMFGAVKDKLGELTSSLTDWKGPPSKDATLLAGAGQLIINGLIAGMESRYGAVRASLRGLTGDIADLEPVMPGIGSRGLSTQVDTALGTGGSRTFNYYAAPGVSLSSEEELFTAVGRSRMVGW